MDDIEFEKKLKSTLLDLETEYDYALCKEAGYLKILDYYQKIAQLKTKIEQQYAINKSLLESIGKPQSSEFKPKVVTESMPSQEWESFVASQQKIETWESFKQQQLSPK